MRCTVFLLLLFMPLVLPAQFTYITDQSIPVKDLSNNPLPLAWAGGLNAAQANTLDLDHDGDEDLVLFDRMANKVITFLRGENQYQYAPEYESLFPEDVTNWVMLRDYNCDGRKDIFTGDIFGIKVFKNTSTNSTLSWEPYLFFTGGPVKTPVLQTKGFSGKINLQLQFDDLPAITDADDDGDLDIFNIRFVGDGTIEYHRNYSMERYGKCDSLDFERITQTWGNFLECFCGTFAFNGSACPPNGGRTKHAGGKALLALDVNGDQQQDLVFSEAECSRLYLLTNQGTIDNPVINSASEFPDAHPVAMIIFPAAFHEDVDFDGRKDIVSSPNLYRKESLLTDLRESTWFYKNTGTAETPVFTFVQRNFLQDQMIDVGDNSAPAFTDVDGDGDYDMLVSRNSSGDFTSTVFMFENTGGVETPEFKLADEDFLRFSFGNFYNIKLQVADINSDNTSDLVFTATSFDNNQTGLYYIANKSHNKLDVGGQPIQRVTFNMLFDENVYITQVDADGLPDILAGRVNGKLEFWKNAGVAGTPTFTMHQSDFLKLSTQALTAMAIATADLNGDGKTDLIFSDDNGSLQIVSDYRTQAAVPQPISNLVYNPLVGEYTPAKLGGKLWPTAVNIFNATKPAIVVGNTLGGVRILKHDESQSLPPLPVVHVYPNPLPLHNEVNITTDRAVSMQIITTLGQQINNPVNLLPNEVNSFRLPFLSPGLYLLKFSAGKKKSVVRRLVIYE